jgi:hypothetical protein
MKWLGIFAALVAGAVVMYQIAFPSATVRYRLTLEADVGGRPAVGSGVIEVSYVKNPKLLPNESEFQIDVRGQAVALDLGERGTLFALLKGGTDDRSGAEWIVLRAFDFPGGSLPRPVEEGVKQVQRLSGKRELPLTSVPLLVRFRDLNDPKTVERVDPLDIGKSFGAGSKLVRATLEIVPAGIWPLSWYGITGMPITAGVEKRLPWLMGIASNIDGTSATTSRQLSNELHVGNFKSR